jgi:hypothetical protein
VTREHTEQEAAISQTEAIRRAIAALGSSAQVPQILDYIRDHFGMGSGGGAGESPDLRAEAPSATALAEGSERDSPSGKKPPPRRGKPKDRPAPE